MDGYAVAEQTTAGIRQRLFSRAVIYVDASTGDRVCMVTVDTPLMFQSVFLEVVRRLQQTYGDTYRADNVVLQASHTHVGPGGRSGHAMVDLVSVGFRPVTFEAQVTGIVSSIIRAHDTIGPAELTLTSTEPDEVGANRSHLAFERNPQEDKDANPGGIDRTSVALHISRNGSPVGLVNWYSIHGTAFNPGDPPHLRRQQGLRRLVCGDRCRSGPPEPRQRPVHRGLHPGNARRHHPEHGPGVPFRSRWRR